MQYHVLSNLNHDNKEYVPGATIDLEQGSTAAVILLEGGIIGTEAPATPAPAPAPVAPEPAKQPEVGGKPLESGEPSLDGQGEPSGTNDAEDVTPVVSEKMHRDELEAAAREAGIAEEDIEAAPNKGALVDLITAHKPAEEPAAPEVDPSANL